MDEPTTTVPLERRITLLEQEYHRLAEHVQWLLHHQHVGGQYSEPVHIHLTPDRVILHNNDVIVECGETTRPLQEAEEEGEQGQK